LASFTFIAHVGFSTTILALVLDSLVRVSRRVGKNHFDKIALSPSSQATTRHNPGWREHPGQDRLWHCLTPSCLTPAYNSAASLALTVRQHSQYTSAEFISTASASTISSLLTLFSKCFSSFLHSTCSLSVSYVYLALEEVYLPLSAPVSRYTTLWPEPGAGGHHIRGFHPLWRAVRGHFCVPPR